VNDASTAEHVPGDLLTIEEWAAMPEDDEEIDRLADIESDEA